MKPNTQINREWMGLRELTAYANISELTLRSWMRRPLDPLPGVQVGGKILIRLSEFNAWLEQHRIKSLSSVDVDAIVGELVSTIR